MKILKKKIFKIEFDLASALAVGSGENRLTDKDIVLGSDKRPYIPASAIAGICIDALDIADAPEKRKYKDYWGYVLINTQTEDEANVKRYSAVSSRITFYDALLDKGSNPVISVRDSVALDEYKTAKEGSKFDMEVLEPGVHFITYVEQTFFAHNDTELGSAIVELFLNNKIHFGGKTLRGYGSIENSKIRYYEIDFNGDAEAIKTWAKSTLDELPWADYKYDPVKLDSFQRKERTIKIELKQVGGISIRRYTTEVAKDATKTAPDFTQLITSSGVGKDGKMLFNPVIPGTSWAGAFEHQIKKNLGSGFNENEWYEVFGWKPGDEKNEIQRSKIRFGESSIQNTSKVQLSRNAIDRFTGGTSDKALFTEITYYCGTTELNIGIADDIKMPDKMARAFAASIVDLHYGFMSVGGETSIGRGMFKITKVEGINSIPDDTSGAKAFFDAVYEMILGEAGQE